MSSIRLATFSIGDFIGLAFVRGPEVGKQIYYTGEMKFRHPWFCAARFLPKKEQ